MTSTIDPLAEEVLSSETEFKGVFLHLIRDEVKTPDGVITIREYLHHPGASAIIPLTDEGNVILEKQYRHPVKKSFIEIPAGKLDPRESPLNCAKRELREETGFEADHWELLGRFNNAIGYSDEEITIFFAEGLRKVGRELDPGEVIDLIEMPWQNFVKKCREGEIRDVKTIVAAFWLEAYMQKKADLSK